MLSKLKKRRKMLMRYIYDLSLPSVIILLTGLPMIVAALLGIMYGMIGSDTHQSVYGVYELYGMLQHILKGATVLIVGALFIDCLDKYYKIN